MTTKHAVRSTTPRQSGRTPAAGRAPRVSRRAREQGDTLDALGVSPAAARLLRYFVVHPDAAVHGRHLQRLLGLGSASLQREVDRLIALGALERIQEGRLVRYRLVPASRLWQAIQLLVRESPDATPLVRDALCDVSGIEAAFIFGSTVKGTARPDSDLDLFIVEAPSLDRRSLNRQLSHLGLALGREVNAVRYSPQALGDRLGDPEHAAHGFARDVLTGPKRWVVGSPTAIRPLAAAAGIVLSDVPPDAAEATGDMR